LLGVFRQRDSLGRRLVVILKGFPCSWGRCSFCPFALEQSFNLREIIETNRRIVEDAVKIAESEGYERVAVFNGSSFHELLYDTVERLRPLARGRVFEVEERSEYVTRESIEALLSYYSPRRLVIRIGFEVFDERIREELLRKGMPNTEVFRVARLRKELKRKGYPVDFLIYVLFGIEHIPEEKVVESVREFKKLFDGVIAVRYRKYLPNHPREVPVSEGLAAFLNAEADLVDWGGEQWEFQTGKAGTSRSSGTGGT